MKLALELVKQARAIGAEFTIESGRVRVRAPMPLPSNLLESLRDHKAMILEYLISEGSRRDLKDYVLRYADQGQSNDYELYEICSRVEREGYVLLWSTVLEDFIAFYRGEDKRREIPPGFVHYSEDELWELFKDDAKGTSLASLRLVHEAKKHGGNIVSSTDHRINTPKPPGNSSNLGEESGPPPHSGAEHENEW